LVIGIWDLFGSIGFWNSVIMARIIAVAGKGGSGKTTVATLLTRELKKRGKVPILAIDADPVANLGPSLGIKYEKTIGQVEQEFLYSKLNIPPGMTKASYLELRLNEAIAEAADIDLLVMGRPEGPGCYCSVHNMLHEFIERLSTNYQYLIVDNEAGMEHFSRGTIPKIDNLLLVSDPTRRGIRTVRLLLQLIKNLGLEMKECFLVIDRSRSEIPPEVKEGLDSLGVEILEVIPEDEEINRLDLKDRPLIELKAESAAAQAVSRLCDRLIN
jgi:CO dehydrogenase maturation factor